MLDKLVKYLPLASFLTIIGMGIAIVKYTIEESAKREADQQRMHSTPEERILLEEHLKNVDEDFKRQMRFEEHVDEVFHEFQETAKALREQRKQDSILKMRDAVTNYQTKQQVDTLIKFWREYNEKANQ